MRNDLAKVARERIEAVPTFLINGRRVQGAQAFPVFEEAIEQALAASDG